MLEAMEPKIYAIINLVHVIKHVHATVRTPMQASWRRPPHVDHPSETALSHVCIDAASDYLHLYHAPRYNDARTTMM
jgi:hypothetical protein